MGRQPEPTLWDRFELFPHGFLLFAVVCLVSMAIVFACFKVSQDSKAQPQVTSKARISIPEAPTPEASSTSKTKTPPGLRLDGETVPKLGFGQLYCVRFKGRDDIRVGEPAFDRTKKIRLLPYKSKSDRLTNRVLEITLENGRIETMLITGNFEHESDKLIFRVTKTGNMNGSWTKIPEGADMLFEFLSNVNP